MQPDRTDRIDPQAWHMLGVLMLVYVLNFIDRQLLTILAPDIKRDLRISDSDFGFLYGTAFGVFYALFGIPLGKLADRWSRVRLLTLGLSLWSVMTALCGLSRNFGQVAAARVGVGVGEATAAPCAYSLIADSFPPQRRSTALGIYSAGLYLGGGISLFLGSSIASAWNDAFAGGHPPFGLVGWQAAFLAVGLPGLLLALWVAVLPEPVRGRFDPPRPAGEIGAVGSPWRDFLRDVADVLPPLTLFAAATRGIGALAANLLAAALIAVAMWLLVIAVGDPVQWTAVGLGMYAIVSWASALRHRERPAFDALLRSRPFVCVTLGYSLVAFVGYASTAFTPLFAIEVLGADAAEAGLILGGMGAVGGSIGVIGGGILSDRWSRKRGQAGRVQLIFLAAAGAMAGHALSFSADSLALFYTVVPVAWIFTAATLGAAAGVVVDIVSPNLRGTATAAFLLGTNMVGLALGPYTAGKMAMVLGGLGPGLLSLLVVVPLMLSLLGIAWRDLSRQR